MRVYVFWKEGDKSVVGKYFGPLNTCFYRFEYDSKIISGAERSPGPKRGRGKVAY